jgi:hypothetical protein
VVSVESVFEVMGKVGGWSEVEKWPLVVGVSGVAKAWDSVIWVGKKELFAGKFHN